MTQETVEQFCARKGITVERYYELKERLDQQYPQPKYSPYSKLNRAARRKLESIERKVIEENKRAARSGWPANERRKKAAEIVEAEGERFYRIGNGSGNETRGCPDRRKA